MRDHRDEIIAVTHALDDAGMVPNKSGNVSCRVEDGFAITPAGIPYRELTSSHIVTLPLDAQVVGTEPRPSSEWRMHAAIYRARPDVMAVVHTHSPSATALAAATREMQISAPAMRTTGLTRSGPLRRAGTARPG